MEGGNLVETAVFQASENLLSLIELESQQPVSRCYQCKKCSAGCPVGSMTDLSTSALIRMVQLGDIEMVLNSNRLWLCLSCKTCQARCPNGIDASVVTDVLKTLVMKQGRTPGENRIPIFYRSFMDSVKMTGRLYELGMIGLFKMRSGAYMEDMRLGIKMLRRGKLKFLPERVKNKNQIKAIFQKGGEAK
ncbi:4Fe-4S dicluster domain-containing protein [Phosphitispora sp. TUW77]|uniref:4Fe-4S dicluster domain-containing protein n=1 Tax=Phosphitispora sp. TUW77 TaxID=3152361 RepID=UPI003AB606E8